MASQSPAETDVTLADALRASLADALRASGARPDGLAPRPPVTAPVTLPASRQIAVAPDGTPVIACAATPEALEAGVDAAARAAAAGLAALARNCPQAAKEAS